MCCYGIHGTGIFNSVVISEKVTTDRTSAPLYTCRINTCSKISVIIGQHKCTKTILQVKSLTDTLLRPSRNIRANPTFCAVICQIISPTWLNAFTSFSLKWFSTKCNRIALTKLSDHISKMKKNWNLSQFSQFLVQKLFALSSQHKLT